MGFNRLDHPPPGIAPLAQRYRDELAARSIQPDPAQAVVIEHTQRLYDALLNRPLNDRSRLDGLRGWLRQRSMEPVEGLYLWGGVGRGKTRIMNAFHDALPFSDKLRIHFHSFMQYVHGELKQLERQSDPLALVAGGLAEDTRVICFDEFQVTDITDAMLLARLLEALFERGVTLVATSNVAPDDLYRGGFQRARFLPAIDLLARHMRIVRLDGDTDYRLRALERAEIYHWPLDEEAESSLAASFAELAPENPVENHPLEIAGRSIRTRWSADGIAWFDFSELCDSPRSSADYIEIAKRFHTVLVGGVPTMDDASRDPAVRFIHLIDELYEHRVNLIVSAQSEPAGIYTGVRLAERFARTRSRLEEMRHRAYLSLPHVG